MKFQEEHVSQWALLRRVAVAASRSFSESSCDFLSLLLSTYTRYPYQFVLRRINQVASEYRDIEWRISMQFRTICIPYVTTTCQCTNLQRRRVGRKLTAPDSRESEDDEDYCSEDPCSSDSESYDSHAEESIFSVTLADSPQNAAAVLLQLHKTNNIMRDWFAEELHNIMLSSSDPRWTAFLHSGLQDVLMDIACDPNMLKFDEVPDYPLHVSVSI